MDHLGFLDFVSEKSVPEPQAKQFNKLWVILQDHDLALPVFDFANMSKLCVSLLPPVS